jgi:hypothetical protein
MFVLPRVRKIIVTDLVANIEEMQRTVEEFDTDGSPSAGNTGRHLSSEPADAKKPGLPSYHDPAETNDQSESNRKPRFVTRVFELKYASVQEIAPLIQKWRRPEGTLGQSRFPPGKIVVTDTPERIDEIARIIRELDVPAAAGPIDAATGDGALQAE